MEIIRKANEARIGCLGKQKIIQNEKYRALFYTTYIEVDAGFLAYNNLTDELILLSKKEKESLDSFNITDNLSKILVEKWYYVPESFSDIKLNDQLNNFMNFLVSANVKGSTITKYTIFPTTDCNARCFYCYEKNVRKIHMSEKTAQDTADYIIKHSGGERITIRWFGGEPLYNSKAIDIICKKLRDANIKFVSSMISNGFLFDDSTIQRAKNLWNLNRVQITLDGTEEKYNKIKAFIHPDVNAFKTVISNIEKLLEENVFVVVRMNMDAHNYENLFELVRFLADKFKGYKNLRLYSQTLFDESSERHMNRTDDDRDVVFKNNHTLNSYIKECNLSEINTLKGYLKNNQCMADDDKATTITPDGNLGKCEHFSDKYFWGSIYSDNINQDNIIKFKKQVPLTGKCAFCPVRPACLQLENCPDARRCNDVLQRSHLENVKNRIINTYALWKQEN